MNFSKVKFILSAYSWKQLPEPEFPEIAFAGRSNVGKSSLINRLVNRRNLVKTSSKPGKTQSLNYFSLDDSLYLVDLPGYGYAKVSKKMQESWQKLITDYLLNRENLACVVVIIDGRHGLKEHDRNLIDWLRHNNKRYLPVYTKMDKLSKNLQMKNSASLDAALSINSSQRLLFSAKTGMGCSQLQSLLASYAQNC